MLLGLKCSGYLIVLKFKTVDKIPFLFPTHQVKGVLGHCCRQQTHWVFKSVIFPYLTSEQEVFPFQKVYLLLIFSFLKDTELVYLLNIIVNKEPDTQIL